MNNNLPYLRLFPGDYLRSNVSVCSIGAQGLWFRILILLHDSERRGYLTMNNAPMLPAYAARQCSVTPDEYDVLLAELLSVKALSRSSDGTIFLPQMVAEFGRKDRNAASQRKSRALKKQGDKPLNEKKKRHRSVTPPVIDVSSVGHRDNSDVIFQNSISKEKDKSFDLSKKKKRNENSEKKSEKSAKKKPTLLPKTFPLSGEMIDWARINCPNVSPSLATRKFINHFRKNEAQRADWRLAWENYLLTAQDWYEQNNRASDSPPGAEAVPESGAPLSGESSPVAAEADEAETDDLSPPASLDEKSRENALVMLRGMLRNSTFERIATLEDQFAPEDWAWLADQLEKTPDERKTGGDG